MDKSWRVVDTTRVSAKPSSGIRRSKHYYDNGSTEEESMILWGKRLSWNSNNPCVYAVDILELCVTLIILQSSR